MKIKQLIVFTVFATTLIAGCGSDGEKLACALAYNIPSSCDPKPEPQTPTYNLHQAYVNFLTSSQSKILPFNISGSINGSQVTGSGTYTFGQLTNAIFEGRTSLSRKISVSGIEKYNNQNISITASSYEHTDSNYNLLGMVTSVSNSEVGYYVVNGIPTLPTSAKVGDSGPIYNASHYSNSSKSSYLGTVTETYEILADSNESALVKIINIEKNTYGTTTNTETSLFKITNSNTYTLISVSSISSNSNIIITYN